MATLKSMSACLAQLETCSRKTTSAELKKAANWMYMFAFMTDLCKRVDETTAARPTTASASVNNYNENVEKICNHSTALQVLREVLLSLSFADSARRTWSIENPFQNALEMMVEGVNNGRQRSKPQQTLHDFVTVQSDDERRQTVLSLLKLLYAMSNTTTARKEFFQNGFMLLFFSLSLSPLCMCFEEGRYQQTRGAKHKSSCVKNCAETLPFIANDDSGDIRYHATNILCNVCYCDPLKELIGGRTGVVRVRALVAVAEHSMQKKQYRVTTSALGALRNLTSNRVNVRVLGALELFGRLLHLLRKLFAEHKKSDKLSVPCEHLFAIFINASRSVRGVDCLSMQTTEMFKTLSDVCQYLHNNQSLYKVFEQNCDVAGEKCERRQFDSSDEGSMEIDASNGNTRKSSVENNGSAADATDSSEYDQRKRQPPQAQQQQRQKKTTFEDDRLLESAQVFLREQNIDTSSHARTNTAVCIESVVPNFNFADIQFKQIIGKGTYSIVHSALYGGFPIAAKVLKTALPSENPDREKLLLEFRLMAMLRHPNIVQLMGLSCMASTNQLVVCTELCVRGSLKENLEKVFDMTIRTKFARNIIAGLQWLHCNNIIHRDLKPANMLVREDFSVVIADFGLSLYVGSNPAERPVSKHFKGNIKYAAPEILQMRLTKTTQKTRQSYPYSFASDVYSFSLILWEIFAPQQRLFGQIRRGRTDITEFVVSGGRPKLLERWPSTVCALLQRCWHAEPERRLQFSRIQQQFDAMIIDFLCPDTIGRALAKRLWQSNESEPVRYSTFEKELETVCRINLQQTNNSHDYRQCLQFMLCDRFESHPRVTLQKFCDMLQYLGSLSPIEQFFETTLSLFKQPWFFGFIRKEEAETLLAYALHEDRHVPGYYLMRFSSTHKGSFVLHMIDRDGHLFQRIIMHQYVDEYTVTLDNKNPSQYSSLAALLKECNQCDTCLKGMRPVTSSPFTKYFKNYQIEPILIHRSSDSTNSDANGKARVEIRQQPPPAAATPAVGVSAAAAKQSTNRPPNLPDQQQQQHQQQQMQPKQPKQQQQYRAPQHTVNTAVRTIPQPTMIQPMLAPKAQQQQQQQQTTQQQQQQQHIAVEQRQLAGRTISLVNAAKTASSQNTSRWTTSMSTTNSKKSAAKKEAKKNDLLKLL